MTSVLLYALGILIIVLLLGISIALHEIGHLLPAKLFGVKVTQYMIGFGRTLWSRKKGETEYGVKILPLGGYVAMIGMYPPSKPGRPRANRRRAFSTRSLRNHPSRCPKGHGEHIVDEITRVGDVGELPDADRAAPGAPASMPAEGNASAESLSADGLTPEAVEEAEYRRGLAGWVDEARDASAETIANGEDHRTFYRLPVWKKIVVMAGGPLMNLLLAFLFFGIVMLGFGVAQTSTTLGAVNECLVPASSTQTTCGSRRPCGPRRGCRSASGATSCSPSTAKQSRAGSSSGRSLLPASPAATTLA